MILPRELEKLGLHEMGFLAQKRLARGLQLNHLEAKALICNVLMELIRDGTHSASALSSLGKQLLGKRHVMPSVQSSLDEVQLEATFRDGTKLVTVHHPISTIDGNLEMALYGSFLPIPSQDKFPLLPPETPGQIIVLNESIQINKDRPLTSIKVTNDGDRPIQVGSHFHFVETNALLRFDRELSYGKRLNIPAGTAVRFEPGETKIVTLTDISGKRVIRGGSNVASGPVGTVDVVQRCKDFGFSHEKLLESLPIPSPLFITRQRYSDLYGPTVGDKIRLADTCLFLEIEKDYTIYGDECVFGGGKVIREGMGQADGVHDKDALDLCITNVVIVDHSGIYKADIGIKNGFISGIGKAGNPDIMDGVTPGMTIGATTEILAGEGKIMTAGALDTHIHFICPQLCYEALASGTTTLIGGGTGPNTGTRATTCTPGSFHIQAMLKATDSMPMNFGFTGKGNSSSMVGLEEQIQAGAVGLKLHEDWGSSPAAIDACLSVCEKYDVQTTIHTDTLNESGFLESTMKAFKGRTIHAYHCEGAGGGHAPDILACIGEPNILPSSTNPTNPYTVNTLEEHLDMLMVCHHLSKDIPEDIAFADSRIRGETIAAEDVLHDMGAIAVLSSDSQAMGRVGEVISRTWQTAHKMAYRPGLTPNQRIKRYVSKYTINPAIAHGVSHLVGSVEVGKLADLVLYEPKYFGTKPDVVLKGGIIVYAQMGDPNASIPTPEPVLLRPMFGANSTILSKTCITFVSKVSLDNVSTYGLTKRVEAVKNCRTVTKKDMKHNDYLPKIHVDPETYQVTVDGTIITCEPADTVPMAQSIHLF